MKSPLISINIPTFNSAKTLEVTLKSIKKQTYKNYEIIIIDHYSTDDTLKIAKKYTKKIFLDKGRLLSSRRIGVKNSKGDYVVLLDSDQVLEPTILQRTVDAFKNEKADMVVLEERSYRPKNFVERMTDLDRKLVHERFELDPAKSVILPRVFKRSLLREVFSKLDTELDSFVVVHDHAIIYFESWKRTQKVAFIRNAVFHMEPNTFKEVYHHYYAWGKRSKDAKTKLPKEYDVMFNKKMKSRLATLNVFRWSHLKITPLVFVKGVGFTLGQTFG